MPLNPEVEVMRGLWRQANRKSDGIEIPCRSASEAKKIRFQLYNSVRDARKGADSADSELIKAVADCMLSFKEDEPHVLVIRQKMRNELFAKMAELAGDAVRPDANIEESLARTLEKAAAEGLEVEGRTRAVDKYFGGANAKRPGEASE